jgi:hypothetical protein
MLQKGKHQAGLSAGIPAVLVAPALVERTCSKSFEGIYSAKTNRSDPPLY